MGYFIHMVTFWQMEFNSFLFFCKAHYDYTVYRSWKVDDYLIFRNSSCYSFAEWAKILEGFPQDTGSKTYCDKTILLQILYFYI